MNTNKKGDRLCDRQDEEPLREETNKPVPLNNKAERNFQRQNQGPQQDIITNPVTGEERDGSSSGEEKDII
jgi:hypothetical protein